MITQNQINKEIYKNRRSWTSDLMRVFSNKIDYETARILCGSSPSRPSAQVKTAHKHGALKPYNGIIPDEQQIRVINSIPYLVPNTLTKDLPTQPNELKLKRERRQSYLNDRIRRALDKHFSQPSINAYECTLADNTAKVELYVKKSKTWHQRLDIHVNHVRKWHALIDQSSNTWLLAYKHGYAQTPEGAQLSTGMAWMHKEIRRGLDHTEYVRVPLHKVFVAELDGITSIGKTEGAAKTGLTTKIKNHVGNRLWD